MAAGRAEKWALGVHRGLVAELKRAQRDDRQLVAAARERPHRDRRRVGRVEGGLEGKQDLLHVRNASLRRRRLRRLQIVRVNSAAASLWIGRICIAVTVWL